MPLVNTQEKKGIIYRNDVVDFVKPLIKLLYKYFIETKPNQNAFETLFNSIVSESSKFLNSNLVGLTYKFLTMVFKHLFCYVDTNQFKSHFDLCYLPLDYYTLNWVKSLGNKDVNDGLKMIKNAFSKIDTNLFKQIQKLVRKKLNKQRTYKVSFAKNSSEIILSERPLEAEFIIWRQEKLSKLHKTIFRNKADFKRLGIQEI